MHCMQAILIGNAILFTAAVVLLAELLSSTKLGAEILWLFISTLPICKIHMIPFTAYFLLLHTLSIGSPSSSFPQRSQKSDTGSKQLAN